VFLSLPIYTQHLLVLLFGTFRVIHGNSESAKTGMTAEALGVSVAPSFFQVSTFDEEFESSSKEFEKFFERCPNSFRKSSKEFENVSDKVFVISVLASTFDLTKSSKSSSKDVPTVFEKSSKSSKMFRTKFSLFL
jgi:hypothetical protein